MENLQYYQPEGPEKEVQGNHSHWKVRSDIGKGTEEEYTNFYPQTSLNSVTDP